jgi:hypothetical protein
MNLVSLTQKDTASDSAKRPNGIRGKVLLVKPPYFSPWTPPLGIAILKSFLEERGYAVRCYDFNADSDLWGMHHKYFNVLQTLEDVSINDGYSKLWWILNAHMLAAANGARAADCARVLASVVPLQGVRIEDSIIKALLPLVEGFYRRLKELTDQFDVSDFSFVGASTYTTSLGPSLFFLKQVKQRHPGIKTVMGGGVFADDLALGSENLDTLVREYDFVDHFILGEGELLFQKLLEGELANKRVISIADLQSATLPMQEVPIPDFSDIDTANYFHLTIEGARSCPFQCSFCSETIQWGEYRKRPMTMFADQVIELARRHNNNSFFLGDSLMNPYINQFAGQLIERKADILYDGYLRADRPVANRDFVKMWADSGCYRVRLGIESASARVLESMDKMTTPAVISEALKALANAGIRTTTYWITGFPGETEDDFQETCEFIREHHRYIYELEAHAYYYYPYGQIGSSLYQCFSIYPEEVTDIIKFKVWEVIGANPPRVERFNRLRRVSELASNLGLPNIYTMAERFAAEERWHRLYPLAREVYQGTKRRRQAPARSSVSVQAHDSQHSKDNGDSAMDGVWRYRVKVREQIDESLLVRALGEVIRQTEILQVPSADGELTTQDSLLQVIALNARPDQASADDSLRDIADSITSGMLAEPGFSLRLALVRSGTDADLLLLAHRAVADAPSIGILLEDLYTAYRQLANGHKVSLRPANKSYSDFINESGSNLHDESRGQKANREEPHRSHRGFRKSETVCLGEEFSRILRRSDQSTMLGLTEPEFIALVVLKSLVAAGIEDEQKIDVAIDGRVNNPDFAHTTGPFTRIAELAVRNLADRASTAAHEIKHALASLTWKGIESATGRAKNSVLLNLASLSPEPWLGGDRWIPAGFLAIPWTRHGACDLEINPIRSKHGIDLLLRYSHDDNATRIVDILKLELVNTANAILKEVVEYGAAREFWQAEFKKASGLANLDVEIEASGEWAITACQLSQSVTKPAADGTVLLASLGILLSRLSGREEAVVLMLSGDRNLPKLFPIKLRPAWNMSFGAFARQVEEGLSRARPRAIHEIEILCGDLLESEGQTSLPDFDVAYVEGDFDDIHEILDQTNHILSRELKLIVETRTEEGAPSVKLCYRVNNFAPHSIERIARSFERIVEQGHMNPDVLLGELNLDDEFQSSISSELLAEELFRFTKAKL